jgi:hypothetical protein
MILMSEALVLTQNIIAGRTGFDQIEGGDQMRTVKGPSTTYPNNRA